MKEVVGKKDLAYWIVILILTIVVVFVDRTVTNDNLVSYIGFAGTIVSIILAVVAIIFSFFQNFTSTTVTQTLVEESKKIGTIVEELKKSASDSVSETEAVILRFKQIETSLSDKIETKFTETKRAIETLEGIIGNQEGSSGSLLKLREEDVKKYVSLSSKYRNLVMYACHLAHKNQVETDILELIRAAFPVNDDYGYSWFVSAAAIRLIAYSHDKEKETYKITDINPYLSKYILPKVSSYDTESLISIRDKIEEKFREIDPEIVI